MVNGQYKQQIADRNQRYWMEELGLFLGVWRGQKAEVKAFWLRWWDQSETLLLWGSEQIDQERQRAEQAKAQLVQVARSLLTQGMAPSQVAELVGLSAAQVEELAAEA